MSLLFLFFILLFLDLFSQDFLFLFFHFFFYLSKKRANNFITLNKPNRKKIENYKAENKRKAALLSDSNQTHDNYIKNSKREKKNFRNFLSLYIYIYIKRNEKLKHKKQQKLLERKRERKKREKPNRVNILNGIIQ